VTSPLDADAQRLSLQVLDALSTGIAMLDRSGRCLFVNAVGEAMLRGLESEMLDPRLGDRPASAEGSAFDRAFLGLLADGVPRRFDMESAASRRSFDVELASKGDVVLVHLRDTTEERARANEREASHLERLAALLEAEREARAVAEDASREKDRFLAVVSHELRTPLNAILGWGRMLRTRALTPERAEHAIEVIERNAVAQAQLIDDLLDASRVVRLEVRELELVPLLEAAADALRPAMQAKRINLVRSLDARGAMVRGDPNRLRQVVWNLLANATKFTPRGGSIVLSLARVEQEVWISVADDGEGIAAELLPRLFRRFQQADMSTTRVHGGLGLGLPIARQIVEMHGGTIDGASEGPGKGACFTVRLPAAYPSGPESDGRPGPAEPSAPRFGAPEELVGLRVLLVDDEGDTLELLDTVLTSCGVRVTTAASAEAARRAVAEETPDVILSDVGMPGEDGYAFIRWLRARPRSQGGGVPSAALTAYARAEDRRRALEAGYDMHLVKPIEPAELVQALAQLARMAGVVR
jgi:signal transduction histidine kinase/ActR/RegA family two-component response regulator